MSFGKCNSFLCLGVCAHVRAFTQLSGAKRIDLLIPPSLSSFLLYPQCRILARRLLGRLDCGGTLGAKRLVSARAFLSLYHMDLLARVTTKSKP